MKKIFFILLCLVIPLSASAQEGGSFAVVELFTSESCSSCPPADAFLLELTDLAAKQHKPIYTLGFHVDYWNYLNWVDEYAQPEFSERQRTYVRKLKTQSVYTPQMIVNGQHEFGGYHRNLAIQYIEAGLSEDAPLQLSADALPQDNGVDINYRISAADNNHVLNCALVERNLSNNILSGENTGRFIKHANVVRSFKSIPLKSNTGQVQVSYPPDLKKENASVILYVQNTHNMKILAAKELPL